MVVDQNDATATVIVSCTRKLDKPSGHDVQKSWLSAWLGWVSIINKRVLKVTHVKHILTGIGSNEEDECKGFTTGMWPICRVSLMCPISKLARTELHCSGESALSLAPRAKLYGRHTNTAGLKITLGSPFPKTIWYTQRGRLTIMYLSSMEAIHIAQLHLHCKSAVDSRLHLPRAFLFAPVWCYNLDARPGIKSFETDCMHW